MRTSQCCHPEREETIVHFPHVQALGSKKQAASLHNEDWETILSLKLKLFD